jgi:hypothetical protein
MPYEICGADNATHVRITDTDNCEAAGVTHGGIYRYYFDDSPEEQTYYIEADDGVLAYDFEVILECEYLRKVGDTPAHEPPAYVRRAIAEYTDAGIARKYIVDPVFRTDYASDRERAIGEYGWRHFDELIAYLYGV